MFELLHVVLVDNLLHVHIVQFSSLMCSEQREEILIHLVDLFAQHNHRGPLGLELLQEEVRVNLRLGLERVLLLVVLLVQLIHESRVQSLYLIDDLLTQRHLLRALVSNAVVLVLDSPRFAFLGQFPMFLSKEVGLVEAGHAHNVMLLEERDLIHVVVQLAQAALGDEEDVIGSAVDLVDVQVRALLHVLLDVGDGFDVQLGEERELHDEGVIDLLLQQMLGGSAQLGLQLLTRHLVLLALGGLDALGDQLDGLL